MQSSYPGTSQDLPGLALYMLLFTIHLYLEIIYNVYYKQAGVKLSKVQYKLRLADVVDSYLSQT